MAAGLEREEAPLRSLVLCGLTICIALGLLTLLYVNFPPDVDMPYGIHRYVVAFFALVWPYPIFSLSPGTFQLAAIFTIVLLWAAYTFTFWKIVRLPNSEDRTHLIGPILTFALIFNLLLLFFFPPVLSGDVFHYAMQGRLNALHGLNPYVTSPSQVTGDPFLPLTLWKEGTTQYGPVWIQLASLCAWLGDDSVLFTVYWFKLLAMLSNVIGAFLVFVMARRFTGGDGVAPLLFYAWNPILLIESAGTAHNDIVMMVLALVGVSLIWRDRLFLGIAALLASVMIKYTTLLLLAFVVVYVLLRESALQRVAIAVRVGLVSIAIVILFYAPFLSGISDPSQLLSGMSTSLNPMPNNIGAATQQVIGALLMVLGVDPVQYTAFALNGLFAILLVYLVVGLAAPQATLADVWGRFGLATLIYTYLIYGGSFPWYLVCPFTALALAPATRAMFYVQLLTIGLGFGFMLQIATLVPK